MCGWEKKSLLAASAGMKVAGELSADQEQNKEFSRQIWKINLTVPFSQVGNKDVKHSVCPKLASSQSLSTLMICLQVADSFVK